MAKTRKPQSDEIILRIPAWTARVSIFLAVVLLPWTIYLGYSLPERHIADHWDVIWTGLDIGMIISFLATGIFAYIRSRYIVMAASISGTLLLVDAWFDVISEKKASDFNQALILAFAFEIPLAIVSFFVASRALKHNIK